MMLSVEDTDEMLDLLGWNLDCWLPLEISHPDVSSATGFAAKITIAEFKKNFKDYVS